MADNVKSKNMYELLGNDPDQDSDREPEPPTKAIDKPVTRAGKRSGPEAAPARAQYSDRGGRGGRRGDRSGNEAAYQSGAGHSANKRQGVPDDVRDDRHPRRTREHGTETRRGGRGGRGGRGLDDRHSRGLADHPKQGDLAWGANTGDSELKDEQAGEAIANQEAKEGFDTNPGPPVDADGNALNGDAAEAEEKQKSYAEYLAEQAEKKLNLGGTLTARKANEGSKQDKKWADAKALAKQEEEDFIAGSGPKAKREREQKVKNVLEIDHSWAEARGGDREGARGGRGGRGRGEFRGGEGRGRGGRGRGDRGNTDRPRGGRGGRQGQEVNPHDQSAFPSLGA